MTAPHHGTAELHSSPGDGVPSEEEVPESSDPESDLIAPEPLVQQYDSHGRPLNSQSRAAARRLRRAQNDVLSTIGLLIPTSTNASTLTGSQPSNAQRHGRNISSTAATALDGRTDTGGDDDSDKGNEDSDDLDQDEVEYWTSLGLTLSYSALSHIATAFVRNQRRRLQTLSLYARVPLIRVFAVESHFQSPLGYWMAGEAGLVAFHVARLIATSPIMALTDMLSQQWDETVPEVRDDEIDRSFTSRATQRLVACIDYSVNAIVSLALAPSLAIIALQRLQLIAPRPLIPLPLQYSTRAALLALLPPMPLSWSVASTFQFCRAIPTSALGLSLIMEYFSVALVPPLTRYTRALLPRPDNPDSITLAKIEEKPELSCFYQPYSRFQNSFTDELGHDLRRLSKNITYFLYRTRNFFAPPEVKKHRETMLTALLSINDQPQDMEQLFDEAVALTVRLDKLDHVETISDSALAERLQTSANLIFACLLRIRLTQSWSQPTNALRQELRNLMESAQHELEEYQRSLRSASPSPEVVSQSEAGQVLGGLNPHRAPNGPLSSHPIPASPAPPSIATSSPPSSPPLEPTNVQVRTRAGSTSTLHMDVEINRAAVDGTTYTHSFSASHHAPVVETTVSQIYPANNARSRNNAPNKGRHTPNHQVSAMSLFPSELLTSIMVHSTISLLRLPLESLYLRRLAIGFLGAAAPTEVMSVYGPGAWFGGKNFGSGAKIVYALNIALCLGTEALLNASSWLVISNLTFWIGRKYLSWGCL